MTRSTNATLAAWAAEPEFQPASAALGDHRVAIPEYLQRHYAWAYLWAPAVRAFDHQPLVNAMVFGQYRRLADHALELLGGKSAGTTLLIASAYGNLLPWLTRSLSDGALTVVDVAPIQLERAREKLRRAGLGGQVRLQCMDAEALSCGDGSYDSALMFMLLHELPADARRRALAEALRVLRPGGQLVLAEYGARTASHLFHRSPVMRWLLGRTEPFLHSLWQEDMNVLLQEAAQRLGVRVTLEREALVFGGFYRVLRYRVEKDALSRKREESL